MFFQSCHERGMSRTPDQIDPESTKQSALAKNNFPFSKEILLNVRKAFPPILFYKSDLNGNREPMMELPPT